VAQSPSVTIRSSLMNLDQVAGASACPFGTCVASSPSEGFRS